MENKMYDECWWGFCGALGWVTFDAVSYDLRLDALKADWPGCRSHCVKLAKDQSLSRLDSSPRASPKQTQSFHQIHIQCQKNLSSAPIGVGVIVEISSSCVFAHSTQTSSPESVFGAHSEKPEIRLRAIGISELHTQIFFLIISSKQHSKRSHQDLHSYINETKRWKNRIMIINECYDYTLKNSHWNVSHKSFHCLRKKISGDLVEK